ncbi:hypothetical protein VdG1_08531 [Verticillium dahliae VDG1]|nr:hypothetical protein VdG1_08531 [Verticillium dahliae VDG1]
MADSNAASPRVPDPFYDSDATTSEITITITHRNIAYTFDFDASATLTDLSNAIADQMSIPHATQKLLIPKHGLQKPPLALLNRLKADPGIRASMAKHAFTVQLLTEMEPLANTSSTHEGTTRLLGLNRNKGEVIELRLRTDAHDGYRDYKTIRRTLCHELAHNVHSDHDKDFWALCRQIEREDVDDHGGWQGGEFVVGGGSAPSQGLSRREILAKAAEERLKRMNMDRPDGGRPDSGPSS